MKSCATCYFAKKDPNAAPGQPGVICRRNPPYAFPTQVPHPISQKPVMATMTVWPPVNPKIDGCGEHRDKLAVAGG